MNLLRLKRKAGTEWMLMSRGDAVGETVVEGLGEVLDEPDDDLVALVLRVGETVEERCDKRAEWDKGKSASGAGL